MKRITQSPAGRAKRHYELLAFAEHIPYAQLTQYGQEALAVAILNDAVIGIRQSARGIWFLELNRVGPDPVGSPHEYWLSCVQFEEFWPRIRQWLIEHKQQEPPL